MRTSTLLVTLALGLIGLAAPAAAMPAAAADPCTPTSDPYAGPQDINNDGNADLVVGVPNATVDGLAGAGVVDIWFTTGIGCPIATQRLDSSFFGIAPRAGAGFGSATAMADLDGDEYADLAIGTPGTSTTQGSAIVAHGSVNGIVATGATPLTSATGQTGDRFGAALAASGRDVFVGAPDHDRSGGATRSGLVNHFRVSGDAAQELPWFGEGLGGAPGLAEKDDRFGSVLGVDADSTVVVGEPGEDVGNRADAGTVTVVRTSATTGEVTDAGAVSQDSAGISGSAEAGDRFGAAVSVAGTEKQIAVGVPGEDVGSARDAGLVHLLSYVAAGAPTQVTAVTQNSPSVSSSAEAGDEFGAAVQFIGYKANSRPSPTNLILTVGTPGESVGDIDAAGIVIFLQQNRPDGGPVTLTNYRNPLTKGGYAGGTPTADDRMGAGLSALPLGDSELSRGGSTVVVAIPGDDTGAKNAGLMVVFPTFGVARFQDTAGPKAGERYGVGAGTLDAGVYTQAAR